MIPNDICRCANSKCTIKRDCKRWTDKGNGIVPVSLFEPKNNKCKHKIK